ncbi:MAG: hypothetical protein KF768_02070 [Phycisphaeraceae bacterium]|nr:hypothetical protein [Phycisphaeraceae bacterium]
MTTKSASETRPYPLIFRPVVLEKVWGGRRLARLGKALPEEAKKYGESWEVADMASTSASGAGGGAVRTVIANGALAGKTLCDAADLWGDDLYSATRGGAGGAGGAGFPLLIKYLDASENLSVQVHPSRAYLREHPELGHHLKTESWYIVDAEPGAKLYIGVKEGVTSAEFERRVREGTVEEVLITVQAVAGECHTLPSGTMHALGAGVVVAEVQTASDTTFRVYDWGRQGRELHVAESLACATFADTPVERRTPAPPPAGKLEAGALCGRLATTEFYTIDEARPKKGDELTIGYKCGKQGGLQAVSDGREVGGGREGVGGGGRCFILMVLAGEGEVRSADGAFEPVRVGRGTTVMIPAGVSESAILLAGEGLRVLRVGVA